MDEFSYVFDSLVSLFAKSWKAEFGVLNFENHGVNAPTLLWLWPVVSQAGVEVRIEVKDALFRSMGMGEGYAIQ